MERSKLFAGSGKAEISLDESFFPYEGYSGVHDPLYVRTLVLKKKDQRFVWLVVDLTSMPQKVVDSLRSKVAELSNTESSSVFLSVSHTFQAPHIQTTTDAGRLLKAAVEDAAAQSVSLALTSMEAATVGHAKGLSWMNINRDELTNKGWWKGACAAGPSDKELSVIRIERKEGTGPIAILMNYAVQSSVVQDMVPSDGKLLISGDLAGVTASFVEEAYPPGTVALWTLGAGGDQNPIVTANSHRVDAQGNYSRFDIQDAGWGLLSVLGRRLADDVLRISETICSFEPAPQLIHRSDILLLPGQRIHPDIHSMEPSTSYDYGEGPPLQVDIECLILGTVAIVTTQPELVASTGLELKAQSPYRHTIVATMVNGGAKYAPDKSSYDRYTYAAMNSFVKKGGAEMLRETMVKTLHTTFLAQNREGAEHDDY